MKERISLDATFVRINTYLHKKLERLRSNGIDVSVSVLPLAGDDRNCRVSIGAIYGRDIYYYASTVTSNPDHLMRVARTARVFLNQMESNINEYKEYQRKASQG